LTSQRSFTSIHLIFSTKKEFNTIEEEDKEKVSLSFIHGSDTRCSLIQ